MEKNIFEGAKFGDKFLTKNGCIALYLGKTNDMDFHVLTFLEDGFRYEEQYIDNGRLKYSKYVGTDNDIVSRYQEHIDEEKLDELAVKLNPNDSQGDLYEVGQYFGFQDGFKAGYYSAFDNKPMEE